ncbi:MAG: hypothetical protein WCI88_16390 [Chloroflexota bacterium]
MIEFGVDTFGTDETIAEIKAQPIQGLDDRLLCITASVICCYCIHFDEDKYINLHLHKCAAFDDIPLVIWQNEIDHNNPYPDDKGIRFSQIPGKKRKQF